MKKVCVVVANASRAFFYTVSKKDFNFELIKTFDHPEGRLKETELASDQPGHHKKGSYEPNSQAKAVELEHFVRELCQELEHGRVSHAYTAIVVVAEPHFYGLMHQLAPHQVQKMIQNHFLKDYAHLSERDLRIKLRDTLENILKAIT